MYNYRSLNPLNNIYPQDRMILRKTCQRGPKRKASSIRGSWPSEAKPLAFFFFFQSHFSFSRNIMDVEPCASCAHCARAAPTYPCHACDRPTCARCASGDPLQCLDCSAALLLTNAAGEAPASQPAALCSHCGEDDPEVHPCELCAQLFCGGCSLEVEQLAWPREGVRRCLGCLDAVSVCSSDAGEEEEEDLRSEVPRSAEEAVSWGLWGRVQAGEAPPRSLLAAAAASNLLRVLSEEVKEGGAAGAGADAAMASSSSIVSGGGGGASSASSASAICGGGSDEQSPLFPSATLIALLSHLGDKGPFSAQQLLHALRMLGDAAATRAPPHDPQRTYLTLFSEKWYPRLHACHPPELRRVQLAAAYLDVSREASDDIVGAVCAQKYANVAAAEVAAALHRSGRAGEQEEEEDYQEDEEGNDSYYPASLLASARAFFTKTMAPFTCSVLPRLCDLSDWYWGADEGLDGGWTGAAHDGDGGLPGCLDLFCNMQSKNGLGLDSALDRSWQGSDWVHVKIGEEEMDIKLSRGELKRLRAEARAKFRALAQKEGAEGETVAGRRELASLRHRLEQLEERKEKLMVDKKAAALAALPTPVEMALPAQPRGPLIADATAPLFTFVRLDFFNHNEYVAAALLRRLRGLPLGRRWPAIEKLGAPLAALTGFRGRGEPGSAEALHLHSTPTIVCSIFAAAGSVGSLQWLFDARLFEVWEQRVQLAQPSMWAVPDFDDPPCFLDTMLTAAAAEGHSAAVDYLSALRPAPITYLPLDAVEAALQRGHVEVVEKRLRAELGAAGGDASAAAVVRARWADAVMNACGELEDISATREQRHKSEFRGISPSLRWFTVEKLRAIDAKLVHFANAHGLPLRARVVIPKLVAAGSLCALRALPYPLLFSATSSTSGCLPELSLAAARGGGDVQDFLRCQIFPPLEPRYATAAVTDAISMLGQQDVYGNRSPHHDIALEMLRVLLQRGCAPLVEDPAAQMDLCANVSRRSLEVLKLLHERGAAWDSRIYCSSLPNVIPYAFEQGCSLGEDEDSRRALFLRALGEFVRHPKDGLLQALLATKCDIHPSALEVVLMEIKSGSTHHSARFTGLAEGVGLLLNASPSLASDAIKASFPLSAVRYPQWPHVSAGVRLAQCLAAAGWQWCPLSAKELVTAGRPTREQLATALKQGAPLRAPEVVAAAARQGNRGHTLLANIVDLVRSTLRTCTSPPPVPGTGVQ